MPTLKLPLGGEAVYRGMTGREEDLLTNKKLVRSGEAVDLVVANCVESLRGEDKVTLKTIRGLCSPDRMALLLAIRIESYGPEMEVKLQGQDGVFTVNVDLLEAIEMREAPAEWNEESDFPFEATVKTDDGEITVPFTYMTGKEELRVTRAENPITTVMLLRMGSIEGVHDNDRRRWPQELPVRERQALRRAMEEADCGPQMSLTADDPTTGDEVNFNIMESESFFFPA